MLAPLRAARSNYLMWLFIFTFTSLLSSSNADQACFSEKEHFNSCSVKYVKLIDMPKDLSLHIELTDCADRKAVEIYQAIDLNPEELKGNDLASYQSIWRKSFLEIASKATAAKESDARVRFQAYRSTKRNCHLTFYMSGATLNLASAIR